MPAVSPREATPGPLQLRHGLPGRARSPPAKGLLEQALHPQEKRPLPPLPVQRVREAPEQAISPREAPMLPRPMMFA